MDRHRRPAIYRQSATDIMLQRELYNLSTKAFKVVAISENRQAFGHNEFVLVARDGETWKVQHIQSNGEWIKGQMIEVPYDTSRGRYVWGAVSVECPNNVAPCPQEVLAQLFT